ncbi:MAG: succinylglutamate desuccinylase/aspartoacylase family protein [Armatimonadota bacterium]
MKIGTVDVRQGEKAFGAIQGPQTRGQVPVHIPLHVVNGRRRGPVLVVQAGVSGLEIEPSMVLPHVVDEIDPAQVTGTLIVVPLLNTSGFEFEQKNAIWDDRDLNALGGGRADGTVSEQLIHAYFEQVIAGADAVIDIHTGARWGYFRYAGVFDAGPAERSRSLAAALGLPQVLLGQPEDRSMAFEAAKSGKVVVSAWIGGGPGLRDHREEDMRRVRLTVTNAMRHLGMLPGPVERAGETVAVIRAHTVLRPAGERGLTFMAKERRGTQVRAGEQVGYVMHPFTGEILQEITAPRDGIMLHAGAAWPILPEGVILAIFGDVVEEVR